ncbi:MAG TPA: hydrogenase formation protein HypD [Lentisphaeria bacterium]|nr:MAG: hydrogenase formation protein HypD [Lentisphaerae bacterium GWF2_49_21]HBC86207.1 hydrogenase formation protein HypD [Lentisphaeria bacterium]
MKYIDEFRNSDTANALSRQIHELSSELPGQITIMEVCGTHTMAIAKFAIRSLLPEKIRLVSGPGCPVCVTPAGYIDAAIELAGDGKTIVTFADMINVPGTSSSLSKTRSSGAKVETCYSPEAAVETALKNPGTEIVFLAVGFETTIGPVTSIVARASAEKIRNVSILTSFKLIPPAMEALSSDKELKIDSFLCPAHVSAIIGAKAYEPYVEKYQKPCVIAGFEPLDILSGIKMILQQIIKGEARVENNYSRVVKYEGNQRAVSFIYKYLECSDACWRGLGMIPASGLSLKKEYHGFDAEKRFGIRISNRAENKGCRCGDVLKGKIIPSQCPLFAKTCTPEKPAGPCMVSSEGTCSAYYKYMR